MYAELSPKLSTVLPKSLKESTTATNTRLAAAASRTVSRRPGSATSGSLSRVRPSSPPAASEVSACAIIWLLEPDTSTELFGLYADESTRATVIHIFPRYDVDKLRE